jgi:hypothetical protein
MTGRITELTELTAPAADDLFEIIDVSVAADDDARNKKILRENLTKKYTTFPIVMECPNDAVCYPDVMSFADGSTKISGFWLPNSGTSALCFKCVMPRNLHTTPALKVAIYMIPRTTVANSTVNLKVSRLYVDTTEDLDNTLTAETAIDVELTSTAKFLTIYEYDVTAEATEGEMFHGLLTRTPGATNDDFTEDLLIVWMEGRVYTGTA